MNKYRWKKGSHVSVKADVANHFIERVMGDNDGTLDLDDAVHKSKPRNAPLHNEFEWNNKICGDKYRREQMRYIVRHLEVITKELPGTPVRAYESIELIKQDGNDQPETKHVFIRIEDILADPVARDNLLMRAIRDAISFRKRYSALSEMATIIHVIEDEIEKIKLS